MRASANHKRRYLALLAALVLGAAVPAWARDMQRYPRESVAYAADISRVYQGRYQEFLPVSLQVGLDPHFNSEQRRLLDRALTIFTERALKTHVLDCAQRNGFKDMPTSRTRFAAQLYEALRPLPLREDFVTPSFAFIASYAEDERSVGIGYVGLFNDSDRPLPPFPTRHYLYIALNTDHMGSAAAYRYALDTEYWAGVIAHEFLHNLGYTHPTGYVGSFIKEYGRCVQSNGGDLELNDDFADYEVHAELDD